MSMGDQFLTEIRQIIERNIGNENLSVADLAKEVGLSRSTLHRNLVKLTGKSPSDLITEIRLSKARELLENDAATVSEVAFKVGFRSPSYFIKVFKKVYQFSPGELRRKGSGIMKHPSSEDKSGISGSVRSKRSKYYVHLRLIYFVGVIIAALAVISVLSTIIRTNRVKETEGLENSIGVLPLHNLSGDDELDWICDGLASEIISQLVKVRSFEKVISFSSMLSYKAPVRDMKSIAEELGVKYLVDGSLKKMADEIKITFQLIVPKTGKVLWDMDYSMPFEEVIGIPGEVAIQVAIHLKTLITEDEMQNLRNLPTENLQAYNLYLKGLGSFDYASGIESIDQSIKYFKQALELDPEFALAYSALAASYSRYANTGSFPRSEVMEKARDAALNALEIDNTLGEAHAELAWVRIYQDFDWEEGEQGLRQALQLNPNYALGHVNLSALLTFLKRHDEAIAKAKQAMDLDPLSDSHGRWLWLGRIYLYADRIDSAIVELNRYLSNYPSSDNGHRYLSLAYLEKGMTKEAIEVFSKVNLKGTDPMDGYIYGRLGQTDKVREVLDYRFDLSGMRYVNPTDFTMLYAALGEYDTALDYLEQAFDKREGWLVLLQVEPMYDILRDEPRFKAIQEKMNFPPNI